jgi:LacI family transcriptional regulator
MSRRCQVPGCSLNGVTKPRRPPTIIDVAAAAGVGRSTASRVMSDHPDVKAATREKVLKAAQDLGYSPNPLAQAMLSGRTHTLGVVLADVENPFFAQAMRAITDTARESGYDVILANTDERDEVERSAVQLMLDKRVDGIIVSPGNALGIDHLQRAAASVPVVLIDRKVPALNVDTVVIDNFLAAYHAVEHLTALGHTRIAVTSNASRARDDVPYISSIAERFDGVRAALRASGIVPRAQDFWIGGWTMPVGAEAVARFRDDPPTAILATDSLVALATLAAARKAGLTVPGDLSLITFDSSPWGEAFTPALSVVSQPVRDLGAIATRMAIERINGLSDPAREIQLPSTLIARESTAPREVG